MLLPTNEVPLPQPTRAQVLLARLQESSRQQQLYQPVLKLGSLTPSAPAAAPSPAVSGAAAALRVSPASAAAAAVTLPPAAAAAAAGGVPSAAVLSDGFKFRPEPGPVPPGSAAAGGHVPATQDVAVADKAAGAAAPPEAAKPAAAISASPADTGSAPVGAQRLPREVLPTQHADGADAAAGAVHAAQEPADAGGGSTGSKPVQQAASDPPAPGIESQAGVADFMATEMVASQQPAADASDIQTAECAAMQPQSTEVQHTADPPSAVTEPQAAETAPALLPTTELPSESETAAASGPSQDPASAAANDDAAASVPATQLASEFQAASPASAPDAAATNLPPGLADATTEIPTQHAIGIPIILSSSDDEQQPSTAELPQTQANEADSPPAEPNVEPPTEAHSPPAAPQPQRAATAAARADDDDGLSSSYSGFMSAQEHGGSEASGSVYTDANTFAQSSEALGSTADQGPVAEDMQQDAAPLLPLENAEEQQAEGPADSGVTVRQSPTAPPTAAAAATDYVGPGHGAAAPLLAQQPAQQLAEPSLSSQQTAGAATAAAAAEAQAAAPATSGAAPAADHAAGAAPEPAAAQPAAADSDPGFAPLPDALEDSDADGEPGTGATPARVRADSEGPAAGAAQPEHSDTPPADLHPSRRRAAPRKRLRHASGGAKILQLAVPVHCCCHSGPVV